MEHVLPVRLIRTRCGGGGPEAPAGLEDPTRPTALCSGRCSPRPVEALLPPTAPSTCVSQHHPVPGEGVGGGTRPLGVATSVFWGWRHVEDADQSAAAAPPPPKSDAGINTSRVWAEIWGLLQQPCLYTQPGTRIAAATDARCAAAACWLTQVVSEPQTNVILRDYSRGRIFDLGT